MIFVIHLIKMTDKNTLRWRNNLCQLVSFREKNGRLPSNNIVNSKYDGEIKLNSWYKKQLKNFRLKIGQLNNEENYNEFNDFLQKYNYGNKREIEKINVNGKCINKTSTILLDDDKHKQKIVIKLLSNNDLIYFLELLNQALLEDKRNLINPDLITAKKIKKYDNATIDWRGMPEYKFNEELMSILKINICLSKNPEKTDSFRRIFIQKINQNITYRTSSLWFPHRLDSLKTNGLIYMDSDTPIIPKYPIYIVSYKRHDTRLTAKYLEKCGIDYKIVIRQEDYDNYSSVIDSNKILVLPDEYSSGEFGSIPARNYILHHSRQQGDKRHWILDDNIEGYYRVNDNKRYKIRSGAVFKIIEDYVDRYDNVLMAGHNYKFFVVPTANMPPITLNTRIYSSILLSNNTEFEWNGKYNEDTDLSLRILKAGYPTILFNNIVCEKMATLKMAGGNAEIYKGDGIYLKAKSLQEQHPDVVKVGKKFGRIHHIVDYSKFKHNKLIYHERHNDERHDNYESNNDDERHDEYGLILRKDDNYDDSNDSDNEEEEIILTEL